MPPFLIFSDHSLNNFALRWWPDRVNLRLKIIHLIVLSLLKIFECALDRVNVLCAFQDRIKFQDAQHD